MKQRGKGHRYPTMLQRPVTITVPLRTILALPLLVLFSVRYASAGAENVTANQVSSSTSEDKVIYGTDDRREVYETTDTAHLAWAASTCAVVYAEDLTDNQNGTCKLITDAYQHFGAPACSDEPYGDQPVAPFCTGFMAGIDTIVTAGHCISEADLGNTRFLFGFDMADAITPVLTFSKDQVYTGVQIIARSYTHEYDYSVIRVDRPITAPGASALPLREMDTIAVGVRVGVIGHPSGLPKKIAFGSETRVRKNDAQGFFYANLDSYGGNSGSPVFNAEDGFVEGILVRGNTDFVLNGDCFRSNILQNDNESPEQVSKSATFAGWIYGNNVPPENDLFANAALFPQETTRVTGTNVYATREPDEPEHAGVSGGASLWWRWTAPFSGMVLVSTQGSTIDTLLAIYTGDSLVNLRVAASNDDMPYSRQSQVSLPAIQDTVYYIAVDGYRGEQGGITLEVTPSLVVTPVTRTVAGDNGTTTFTIQTIASWTAVSDQAWALLDTTSGKGDQELTVIYTANSGEERNATITITGQGTSPPWTAAMVIQQADLMPCCCVPGTQRHVMPTLRHLLGDGLLLGLAFAGLWAGSFPERTRFRP
ncbi:MAG TPA: trypsin-like peptidase domain-containing protein [Candidatus Hydrogenedentes bacterium]|nr:trypsin-like peptidase domain-containing protein [Candidatus Hydrogenedentota bacterium]